MFEMHTSPRIAARTLCCYNRRSTTCWRSGPTGPFCFGVPIMFFDTVSVLFGDNEMNAEIQATRNERVEIAKDY